MKVPRHNSPITGAGYGYVYVMSYPGSDKVKIGHALNPTTRAADIGGTLAPEQPKIEALYWCSERREDVERKAHDLERARRHNGEWFIMSVAEAVGTIQRASEAVEVDATLVFDRDGYEAQAAAERAKLVTSWEGMDYAQLNTVLRDHVKLTAKKDQKVDGRRYASSEQIRVAKNKFKKMYPEFVTLLNHQENEERLKKERIHTEKMKQWEEIQAQEAERAQAEAAKIKREEWWIRPFWVCVVVWLISLLTPHAKEVFLILVSGWAFVWVAIKAFDIGKPDAQPDTRPAPASHTEPSAQS